VQRRQLTDAEYSLRLADWLDGIPDTYGPGTRGVRPNWMIVDPSAASFVTQLHHDGFRPQQGDNAVLDGIRTVSNLLAADHLRVHASCTALLDEIVGYAWDDRKAERGEDAPVKEHDHAIDALRYALHTTQAVWMRLLNPFPPSRPCPWRCTSSPHRRLSCMPPRGHRRRRQLRCSSYRCTEG
jgi:hypothetical protein